MKLTFTLLTALLLAPLAAVSEDNATSSLLNRQWVAAGSNGKLEYKTTPKGDRIMDFSHAGYMGGGVALPSLPVKKEVAPSGDDDTAAILTLNRLLYSMSEIFSTIIPLRDGVSISIKL